MTSVSPDNFSTADPYVGRSAPVERRRPSRRCSAPCCWTRTPRSAPRSWSTTRCSTARRTAGCSARCSRSPSSGTVIDHITLRDELLRRGELEAAGGLEYLAELVDAVPTAANLEFHAKIVRDKAILRRLIEASTAIITEAYDGHSTANELLDGAESRIFQISQQRGDEGFTRIKEMLWPTMERIETLQRSGKAITGVPSGFADLDELTSGFQRVGAGHRGGPPLHGQDGVLSQHRRPRGGRGAAGSPSSRWKCRRRRWCSACSAPRRGWTASGSGGARCADSDFTQLARAAGMLQTCPIWIDDTPALTLLEMRSKARRLKVENDLRLIIVDYLQLMRSPEYSENRVQEISDISRSLKALARELEIPVIALSQLSRASEQRGGERKPILSDLRDSGAIEQDADLVIFIHRPEYYDREDESKRGLAEIMLAKNRNGPTGDVEL